MSRGQSKAAGKRTLKLTAIETYFQASVGPQSWVLMDPDDHNGSQNQMTDKS